MSNFRFQFLILSLGLGIAAVKFILYFFTKSNAVFSDALESLVNISANTITLYSLYIASKPRDQNHPYGHGKIEFVASGIEGSFLFVAGVLTIYKSILDYLASNTPELSGWPLFVILLLGFANYLLGYFSIKKGETTYSPALIAGGKHLKSDGYTSFAILGSLIVLYFTHWYWIDTLVSIAVGLYIIYQGYQVVRQSLLDILDTADISILTAIVDYLQQHRDPHWIDIHNLRILKFGSEYHVDAHLTLPFYYTNREVHREMKEVHDLVNEHFQSNVEIFIHPDPCEPKCCHYCQYSQCLERSEPFRAAIPWTVDNVLKNEKHGEGSYF